MLICLPKPQYPSDGLMKWQPSITVDVGMLWFLILFGCCSTIEGCKNKNLETGNQEGKEQSCNERTAQGLAQEAVEEYFRCSQKTKKHQQSRQELAARSLPVFGGNSSGYSWELGRSASAGAGRLAWARKWILSLFFKIRFCMAATG